MPKEPISAFEHAVIHALEELRRELSGIRSILAVLSTKNDLRKTERQIIQSIQDRFSADDSALLDELRGIDRMTVEAMEKLAAKTPNK